MDRNHPAWHGHIAHISSFHMFPCHFAETSWTLLKFLVDSTAPKNVLPCNATPFCIKDDIPINYLQILETYDFGNNVLPKWHGSVCFFLINGILLGVPPRRQTKTAILLVVYPIKAPQTSPISGAPRLVIGLIPSWLIYPAIKQSGKSLMIFPRKHPIILDFPICSYIFLWCSQ
jgi:hypothetical protein